MTRTFFNINSTSHELNVEPERIFGKQVQDECYLNIPIEFVLNKFSQFSIEKKFIIINISAQLFVENSNCQISDLYCGVDYHSERTYRHNYEFKLSHNLLESIERVRNGSSPRFTLKVKLKCAYLTPISQGSSTVDVVSGFLEVDCLPISIEIPQSTWVTKILPQLTNYQFQIIELPKWNHLIKTEYEKSLKELLEAEVYFKKGDYDKVVAHCRSALDPIKVKIRDLKSHINSDSEFEWINKMNESTYEWLDTVLKASMNLYSKTHHLPSIGHFNRKDAEIIFLMTTSIIAYVGNIGL